MRADKKHAAKNRIKIREIHLGPDEEEELAWERGPHRNLQIKIIAYLFVGLFLLLVGWQIHVQVGMRKELVSNAYNTKSDNTSDNVIRGPIITEDGTTLAYTSVDTTGNETRVYPFYSQFAHVVGYATNGKSGLEAEVNNALLNSHSSLMEKLQKTQSSEKAKGDTVIVTLNPKLQEAAWNALGSYKGAVVVMEPDTGKILAMVSKPDFDPNTIGQTWEAMVADEGSSNLLNRATQGLYPPGSTFKMVTMLSYLRQYPNAMADFSFDCTGSVTAGDTTINCYDGKVHGTESLTTAFANSCNSAFATMGLNMDKAQFRETAEDLLFNKKLPTNITTNKSVFELDRNTVEEEVMTTSIGQGNTLVTPLHMAMLTATVANGGIMMKPYLVSRIETAEGETVQVNNPEMYDTLMTVDEASKLTDAMRAVVMEGTAIAFSGNAHPVAGKTGSAEYKSGDNEGTHSWFVGFSNVDDPDLVVAVIAEDGGTGSQTAVPIAQSIFQAYYNG